MAHHQAWWWQFPWCLLWVIPLPFLGMAAPFVIQILLWEVLPMGVSWLGRKVWWLLRWYVVVFPYMFLCLLLCLFVPPVMVMVWWHVKRA